MVQGTTLAKVFDVNEQGIMLAWLTSHDVLVADETWRSMQWMEGLSTGMDGMPQHGAPTPSTTPTAGVRHGQDLLELGDDPQLRTLANGIITGQEREITIMNDWLTDRGATAGS